MNLQRIVKKILKKNDKIFFMKYYDKKRKKKY
jgi:hypothetical protein